MTLRRAMAALALLTWVWCLPGMGVRATRGAHVAVDEPQYLLSATSLAEDGDLDIDDELDGERWRDYHEARLPVQTKRLDGGRQVSPHDPLLPVLLAAPMAVGGWVAAGAGGWVAAGAGGWVAAKVALAAMAGALAAALVWVAVRRLNIGVARASAGVACFSLASPLAVYGTQVYPELPAALAVTLAVGAVLGPADRRHALGTGLAVSTLPWLSVKYAPVAAALAAVALWRLWRAGATRVAVELLVGLAVSGVAFAVGHLVIYGGLTPYATGDHFVGGELTVVGSSPNYPGRARRLVGLVVDRRYGLAAWHPAWILVFPAVGAAVRRRPRWFPTVAPALAAGWITATFVALTMHGYWWSGRQLVVVLPLAVLLVTWWAPTRLLAAGLVVGAVTWWWTIADGLGDRLTWVVHVDDAGSPLVRAVRPLLPDLRHPSGADEARLAAWTVVLVGAALWGWWSAGRHQDAAAGKGADADGAFLDLHGDGAVR